MANSLPSPHDYSRSHSTPHPSPPLTCLLSPCWVSRCPCNTGGLGGKTSGLLVLAEPCPAPYHPLDIRAQLAPGAGEFVQQPGDAALCGWHCHSRCGQQGEGLATTLPFWGSPGLKPPSGMRVPFPQLGVHGGSLGHSEDLDPLHFHLHPVSHGTWLWPKPHFLHPLPQESSVEGLSSAGPCPGGALC